MELGEHRSGSVLSALGGGWEPRARRCSSSQHKGRLRGCAGWGPWRHFADVCPSVALPLTFTAPRELHSMSAGGDVPTDEPTRRQLWLTFRGLGLLGGSPGRTSGDRADGTLSRADAASAPTPGLERDGRPTRPSEGGSSPMFALPLQVPSRSRRMVTV